jgi:hypothetical protein
MVLQMSDFPKQGGVGKQTPKAPIHSGKPSQKSPLAEGGVAWGGPSTGKGNNDKNRPR